MKGSLAMRVFITSCAFLVIPLIFYTAFTYKSEYDRALNQVYDSLEISLGDHIKFVSEITDLQLHYLDALYEIIVNNPEQKTNTILASFVNDEEISSILYLKQDAAGLICFASSIPELVGKNFSGQVDLEKIDTLKRKAFIARDANGNYALYLIRLIKNEETQKIEGAVALSTSMRLLLNEISGFGTIRFLDTTILSTGGDVLATTHTSWEGAAMVLHQVDHLDLPNNHRYSPSNQVIDLIPTSRGFELVVNNETCLTVMKEVPKLPIMIALDVPKKLFTSQLKDYFTSLGSLLMFILVIGGGATYLLTLRISRPLRQLCFVMKEGEEGRLETRYKSDYWGFEINLVGHLYNELMNKIESMIQEIRAERSEKERYATQMMLALEIQRSLLPTQYTIPNLKIASSYFPAVDVAGDIFDCFEVEPHRILVMCSDVVGKGIQACLYSLSFRSFLRSVSMFEKDLAKIINGVNQLYLKDTEENCMFVTAWIGILNTTTRVLEYASLGHPPALLRRHDQPIQLLEGNGIPFGIQKMDEIGVKTIQLEPKDIVVAYTDGVTEAMSEKQELFGMDRLLGAVRNTDVASPENLIQDIYHKIKAFASAEQNDDITILIFEVE